MTPKVEPVTAVAAETEPQARPEPATVAKSESPKETPKATEVAKTETPKPTPKQLLGEPTPAPTSAKSSPEGAGNFTLQVVAYNEKTQADTAVASLKSKGFDAYSVTAQVPGKGTIHRVRALEDTTIIEVSTPQLEDVVRLEDRYGRVEP